MNLKGTTSLAAILALTLVAGCGAQGVNTNDDSAMMMNSDSCGTKVEGDRRIVKGLAKTGDRVYFDLDQSDLQAGGETIAKAQADLLAKSKKARLRIEGNADERGSREYNLALGERRAESLKSRLVSMGVDGSNIETISYGEECPANAASNEEAWMKNRRDVVVSIK